MFTLTIEHAITDYPTWKTAFDRFAEARAQARVLADRVRRPVDDRQFLVVEWDFETRQTLMPSPSFSALLSGRTPRLPQRSPGNPATRILEPVSAELAPPQEQRL